jgi:hypothetical protein
MRCGPMGLLFVFPHQGSGIENRQLIGYKSYQITNHMGNPIRRCQYIEMSN